MLPPTSHAFASGCRFRGTEHETLHESLQMFDDGFGMARSSSDRPFDEVIALRALVEPRTETLHKRQEVFAATELQALLEDEDAIRNALQKITALEALRERSHLVLLGDPGSGKSTLVNHLAFVLAGAWLDEETDWAAILEDRYQQPLFPSAHRRPALER